MASAAPTRKVVASSGGAAAGSAVADILIYVLEKLTGPLPENIESAVSLLVILTAGFAAGYFVPPSLDEHVVPSKE